MRAFARERLAPYAAAWDRDHIFPREALRALGAARRARHGRSGALRRRGLDYVSLAVALEEIAAGDGATSTIVSVQNSVVCGPIDASAATRRRTRYLQPLARGAMLGCFCLTEPHVGSDAAAITTRAERDGDALRAQRRQAVHHLGQERRRRDRVRGHRQGRRQEGHLRVHRRHATRRATSSRGSRKSSASARRTRRRSSSSNCAVPAANLLGPRGRGLPDRAGQSRGGPHRHRRAGGRHGARGIRGGARLRARAHQLRQADRRASGGEFPARRHGDRDRGGAAAGVACGDACATPGCRA